MKPILNALSLTGFRRRVGLRLAGIAVVLTTAGCGVTYNSPSVDARDDEAPVTVVKLDAASITRANHAPYTPRKLPAYFFNSAGTGSGLIGAGALPRSPVLPDQQPVTAKLIPLPSVRPESYRIGVGDVLLLATRAASSTVEQLSGLLAAQNQRQGYTVRDDGAIAIPEVGTVELAGMTIQEAEDKLFQALVEKQIDPAFSLEVSEFNSQRIAVGGAVKQDTLVPVGLEAPTLAEALSAAGGLNVKNPEFATIRVYRQGNLYQIPVEDFLKGPKHRNKVLLNGDAVFVDLTYDLDRALTFYKAQIDVIALRTSSRGTALNVLETEVSLQREALQEQRTLFGLRDKLGAEKRDYVYLSGEVSKQSRFALPFNQQATLADVLYSESGFDNTTGDPTQIYVLRDSSDPAKIGEVTAYHLDARNAADLILATRLQMRPNDVIFIEEQVITKWGRSLQQLFPAFLSEARGAI